MKNAGLQLKATTMPTNNMLNGVLQVLPANIRQLVAALPEQVQKQVEEIRIRQGRPLGVRIAAFNVFIKASGGLTDRVAESYLITASDMDRVIQLLSGSSVYALEEELRNGFITLSGGHRVGITGKAVLEGGKIRTLKHLSCCNIRISREIKGSGDEVLPILSTGAGIPFITPCCCHRLVVVKQPF